MENIKELQSRVIKTGGDTEIGFLFKHLVLTEEEYKSSPSIEELGVDSISIKKKGRIEFLHVSASENLEGIQSLGLVPSNGDWTPDLGRGNYVVNSDDSEAVDNLADYLLSYYDNNLDRPLVVVTGTYEGEYELCVESEGHDGYILIKETLEPSEIELNEVSLKEFIYDYARHVYLSDLDYDY